MQRNKVRRSRVYGVINIVRVLLGPREGKNRGGRGGGRTAEGETNGRRGCEQRADSGRRDERPGREAADDTRGAGSGPIIVL